MRTFYKHFSDLNWPNQSPPDCCAQRLANGNAMIITRKTLGLGMPGIKCWIIRKLKCLHVCGFSTCSLFTGVNHVHIQALISEGPYFLFLRFKHIIEHRASLCRCSEAKQVPSTCWWGRSCWEKITPLQEEGILSTVPDAFRKLWKWCQQSLHIRHTVQNDFTNLPIIPRFRWCLV